MKKTLSTLVIFLLIFPTFHVIAHPGNTDSKGGHYNRSTGDYHYHHGYPEHEHNNGVCPYEIDDTSEKETYYIGRIEKDDTEPSTTEEETTEEVSQHTESNYLKRAYNFVKENIYHDIDIVIFALLFYAVIFILCNLREWIDDLNRFIETKRFERKNKMTETENKNYKKMYYWRTIPLLLICILLVAFIIKQQITIDELKDVKTKYYSLYEAHENLRSSYDKYVDKYKAVKEEYDFYHEGAVCIDEYDRYYHKYECENFDGDSYWIYNIEYAKYKGYKECPICFTENKE